MTAINRRQAYEVVDRLEEALCEFTGSPLAVATDTCTNAIFMSFAWLRTLWRDRQPPAVRVPKHNYVGVVQAIKNAGFAYDFVDYEWEGSYHLDPWHVVDSAKRFERGMYQPGTLTCVSFGSSKRLPVGRGGAILLDNPEAAEWIRPRTMDGRTPGEDYLTPSFVTPAWRCNLTPEQAIRGLDLLTYLEDNDPCDWTAYPDLSKAVWK